MYRWKLALIFKIYIWGNRFPVSTNDDNWSVPSILQHSILFALFAWTKCIVLVKLKLFQFNETSFTNE